MSLVTARGRILALAEPVETIEVSLGEALGLVLAEPVVADVDQPPFDRAARDGYAVRTAEATVGSLLRVVAPRRSGRAGDSAIEAGEAAWVRAGDPIPPGADAVVRLGAIRPDPATGPTRVIEIRRAPRVQRGVIPRGTYLAAGITLAEAGTRIKPALIPLLAAQGCVHPYCHRRVRVSIVAVGRHWVRPDEAPTMNRERNAANAALVALTGRAAAMPHDLQAVSGSLIRPTLERAATNPVVVVLGAPSRPLVDAWQMMGLEPVVDRVAVAGIGRVRCGVLRDDEGRVVNHVFHLPAHPALASMAFALLVQPLIARLQGDLGELAPCVATLADGAAQPATTHQAQVQPATCRLQPDGQWVAEPISGPLDDPSAWAQTAGLIVFSEQSGPWRGGDRVVYVPLAPNP